MGAFRYHQVCCWMGAISCWQALTPPQYQVVGRHLPTESAPEPQVYRMKLCVPGPAVQPLASGGGPECLPGLAAACRLAGSRARATGSRL